VKKSIPKICLHINFTMFLMMSWGITATASDAKDVNLNVINVLKEVPIQVLISHEMENDFPLQDFLLIKEKESNLIAWILGKTCLWKIEINNKKLKKICLGSSNLRHITFDGINLFVASDYQLFQINTHDYKTFRFAGNQMEIGKSIGFSGEKDKILWLTSRAIFRIDRYGKAIIPISREIFDEKDMIRFFSELDKSIWTTKGNKIEKYFVESKLTKEIMVIDKPIQTFQHTEQTIFFSAGADLFLLDLMGNVRKKITIKNSAIINSFLITKWRHFFLFNEDYLQVFNIRKKSDRIFRLSSKIEKNTKTIKLLYEYPLVAVVTDNGFKLYEVNRSDFWNETH